MYQNYLNQNFQVLERGVGLSTHSDSELITQALCLNPPEGEVNLIDFFIKIATVFSYQALLEYPPPPLLVLFSGKMYKPALLPICNMYNTQCPSERQQLV